jgi:ribosomal protein S18 acetylase RimI-like enzyme
MSSAMANDHETEDGTPIKIERMKRAQAKLVHRLLHEVISHLSYYNLRARREELAKYTVKELLLMRNEDKDSIIVAHYGGLLAGFCISRYDDGIIWLSWFGVSKQWRGKGVGSALVARLEATVLQRKCHKIWCDTRTSNKASAKVLKNSGFERICKIEQHWYGQDFYLWQKYIRRES